MKEKLTIKNAWKVIPQALEKKIRFTTNRGIIVGTYKAVPGIGVDFFGDRDFHPLEEVKVLAFQRFASAAN